MKKEINIKKTDSSGATHMAELVALANSFDSTIYIMKDGLNVNAKSIMGMMSLVIPPGTSIMVDANGADEKEAILAIEDFFS